MFYWNFIACSPSKMRSMEFSMLRARFYYHMQIP
ncbi:unnamed protein product [Brassica oleracea var. botrytis]